MADNKKKSIIDTEDVRPSHTAQQAGATESRELADNKAVDKADGKIIGLPPMPASSPINITMTIDDEGHLKCHAKEPRTGRDLTINVRVSVLSEEEVVRAQKAVSAITVRAVCATWCRIRRRSRATPSTCPA